MGHLLFYVGLIGIQPNIMFWDDLKSQNGLPFYDMGHNFFYCLWDQRCNKRSPNSISTVQIKYQQVMKTLLKFQLDRTMFTLRSHLLIKTTYCCQISKKKFKSLRFIVLSWMLLHDFKRGCNAFHATSIGAQRCHYMLT